jgi:AraC-like DNA-binding protein
MYRERALPGVGAVLWTRVAGGPSRVVPDGCLDVLWVDGRLLVAGPDTAAYVSAAPPGTVFVGVRFAPGWGPAVLGVPAAPLSDTRVPLEDVWSPVRARRLAGLAAGAGERPGDLAAGVLRLAADPAGPGRLTRGVAAGLRAGRPVARVAAEVGLSPRHLRRRCLDAFGYGPKTLARVLRFDRALALARAGTPLAEVAATAGYADQPHLAREVRALSGVPLRTLLPVRPEGSGPR